MTQAIAEGIDNYTSCPSHFTVVSSSIKRFFTTSLFCNSPYLFTDVQTLLFLHPSVMSESVRYIHTQAQAQAELERLRELHRASEAARKRKIAADPEYAQQLQANAIKRQQKNAEQMATTRKARREREKEGDAPEREALVEKVCQQYELYDFLLLIVFRIAELDAQFDNLQVKEQLWPIPAPDVTPMYKKFLTYTYKLGQNIVCASCGCIFHDIAEFEVVLDSYEPLHHLCISENVDIPFDFSCGINHLDQNRILIDKL